MNHKNFLKLGSEDVIAHIELKKTLTRYYFLLDFIEIIFV